LRSRIFVKLMFVFLLVIGATAITLQLTVHRVWERTLREQIERNLKQKTLMFAYRVEADRQHSLADIAAQEGQAAGARATVIDPTGKVLADSEVDPSTMENQSNRREFVSALGGKLGVDDRRKSQALGVPFLYVAAPVSGGAVRLAYPLPEMEITDRPLGVALFWGSLAAVVFAMMVAAAASQYVGGACSGS
jgi:two-component system phosphate regulon sensor histidine kinase PhoR